eukprot:COSAG01_NODE_1338_length_10666_cov_79.971231_4_plen_106_part_00
MVVSDNVKAGIAGAAFARRNLAHTLVGHELIRWIPCNATTTPAIDLDVFRVGLCVASEVRLEQRLLEDHVGGGVDHVTTIICPIGYFEMSATAMHSLPVARTKLA